MRVVIVTYNWPPRNAIGTHRPYSWAKIMARRGWQVTVLTADRVGIDGPCDLDLPVIPNVDVHEVRWGGAAQRTLLRPARSTGVLRVYAQTFMRGIRAITGRPWDPRAGWYTAARPLACELAPTTDVVVSTYGPRGAHLLGADMKRVNPSCLWVADYRDPWSTSFVAPLPRRVQAHEARAESVSVGRYADVVTTVSEPLAADLQNVLQKPTHVIMNGMDVAVTASRDVIVQNYAERPRSDIFRFVYTGRVYGSAQEWVPLVAALKAVNSMRAPGSPRIVVDCYGPTSVELMRRIREQSAGAFVVHHGYVNRDTAVALQSSADALLVVTPPGPKGEGVLTGKVFEYMAAQRPIVGIGGGRSAAISGLLAASGVGRSCGLDEAVIHDTIRSLAGPQVPPWFAPNPTVLRSLTRDAQADHLVTIISRHMNGDTGAR